MIDHLEIESICMHKNSSEARKQIKQTRICNSGGRYKIYIKMCVLSNTEITTTFILSFRYIFR